MLREKEWEKEWEKGSTSAAILFSFLAFSRFLGPGRPIMVLDLIPGQKNTSWTAALNNAVCSVHFGGAAELGGGV